MKRLQDDLRRTNRELERSKKEKDSLTTKIGTLEFHYRVCDHYYTTRIYHINLLVDRSKLTDLYQKYYKRL